MRENIHKNHGLTWGKNTEPKSPDHKVSLAAMVQFQVWLPVSWQPKHKREPIHNYFPSIILKEFLPWASHRRHCVIYSTIFTMVSQCGTDAMKSTQLDSAQGCGNTVHWPSDGSAWFQKGTSIIQRGEWTVYLPRSFGKTTSLSQYCEVRIGREKWKPYSPVWAWSEWGLEWWWRVLK